MPNDLGLFDMLGNLVEWCHDGYRDYPTGAAEMNSNSGDTVTIVNNTRSVVVRGLAFNSFSAGMRSASRMDDSPWGRSLGFGFRPARTIP